MSPSRMSEQVGRVLGDRYRLLAPIGRGASAQVFVAADVRLERQVAVKVLHEALADDEGFLRRFQTEAQAAAALNHPNVMAVYDWGHDDDVPWIVTEYLGGGSLRGLLDRGHRLTPSQALVVGVQAARGLDYAHRRGFVHRDVKPANLLFGDDGRLRIADFGLARALAEAAWTEPQGAVVGTARYASPEQAQGMALTGRSDVYSLALVLVEAVTGDVPFATDTTLGTLMARVGSPLVPPPALGRLGEVLAGAGDPEPEGRIDGRELATALAAAAPMLPRPGALPLVGAVDVDLVDERDPTRLGGGRDGDDLDVPAFVNTAPRGPDAGADDAEDDVVDATVALGPFAGAGLLPDDDPAAGLLDEADDDPAAFMAWVPDPAGVSTAAPIDAVAPFDDEDDAPYDEDADGWDDGGWDPRSPTGHRRRRWPRIAFAVVIVALLGAAVGLLVSDLTDAPPSSVVPVVARLDEDAAVASLEAQGWRVAVERRRQDDTERGTALGTDPGEGTDLVEGEPIVLYVSDGPTEVDLPPVARGMEAAEADALLRRAGLVPVPEERFDEEVPSGQVVGLAGEPPSPIERGTEVAYVVSRGPEPRTLPDDLPGATREDVEARLTGLGLVPDVTEEFSDDVEAGVVIGTDPGAAATVEKGATVSVVVSRGPDLVTVPDVSTVGSLAEAVALLEQAGLVADQVTGPARGVPASTSPGAGEQVRRGSAVDVVLTRGDPSGPGGAPDPDD